MGLNFLCSAGISPGVLMEMDTLEWFPVTNGLACAFKGICVYFDTVCILMGFRSVF